MIRTKDRLTAALKLAEAPEWMITKAQNGYYDDYESPLDNPITKLVNDLGVRGFADLAVRAKNGEFDSTKEEGDEWLRKQENLSPIFKEHFQ